MSAIRAGARRPASVRVRPARHRAAAAWLAGLLLLAGCRSLPPAVPEADAGNYAGRFSLAVTHAEPGGAERREVWSGRFALAVGARSLRLDLVSPLGATLARFETDAAEARLLLPEGGGVRVEHGSDPQALAERVLGWSLPIAGLPDWVAGHPAPGRPFRTVAPPADQAPDPFTERFEQDGWTVVVERAGAAGLAQRVQMNRPELAASPAVALRVVLDPPALGATPTRPGFAALAGWRVDR